MFPPKKIVCPTDFSEGSFRALAEASELALYFRAEICLVNVMTPILVPTAGLDVVLEGSEYAEALHQDAERNLREVAAPLTAKGVSTRIVIGDGEAAGEIVRIAQEQSADLIVIATHGNTGWRHLAFGSVTERVVRLATCPVLTIRMLAKEAANSDAP